MLTCAVWGFGILDRAQKSLVTARYRPTGVVEIAEERKVFQDLPELLSPQSSLEEMCVWK